MRWQMIVLMFENVERLKLYIYPRPNRVTRTLNLATKRLFLRRKLSYYLPVYSLDPRIGPDESTMLRI